MTLSKINPTIGAMPVEVTHNGTRCITDEYAGRAEAAAYLRVCKKTLERWQSAGTGPAITKLGRTVYYRWETLRAWVASHECQHPRNPI